MNNRYVTISGTRYLLRFTFDAFLAMQEEHAVNIYAAETFAPSPRLTCVLLWGAIRHAFVGKEGALTPQQIAAGLSFAEASKAQHLVLEALNECLPTVEAKVEPEVSVAQPA